MRIVGITGGIGSGKSSVLKLIESKNITKINSDQIVNNLLRVDSKVIKFCKINFDVHIDQSTKNFAKNNIRILGDGSPKTGAHGNPVIFLNPTDTNGTLIELEEVK